MPRLLLALATAVLLVCAAPAQAIVGGQQTARDWPHMAGLEALADFDEDGDKEWSFICGASLIAPDVVLTAAHCVDADGGGTRAASDLRLLLGTKVRSQGGERIPATEVREHPGYNGSDETGSDVALIKLQRASALGRTIRLAGAADLPRWSPGAPATIIGWGSEFSDGPAVDALKEATVPIVADGTCASSYRFTLGFDPATSVCAGETLGGEDSCQGDSGGPLMVQDGAGAWILVGATSFGLGCAFPTQYGVYAEAGGGLRGWIEQNAAAMSAAGGLNANPPTGTGTPAPAPAPPGGAIPAPATSAPPATRPRVTLPTRLGSARRARRAKKLRVLVRTTARLRAVRVTLRRGSRTVATGRTTSLSGRRRITLRVRPGLRAGRVTLRVQAVDAGGRTVSATRRARLSR